MYKATSILNVCAFEFIYLCYLVSYNEIIHLFAIMSEKQQPTLQSCEQRSDQMSNKKSGEFEPAGVEQTGG